MIKLILALIPLWHTLDMSDPADSLLDVTIVAENAGENPTFSIPIWTTGHYEADMPAQFIQNVTAEDTNGKKLKIRKTKSSDWTVESSDGTIIIKYKAHLASPGATGSEFNPEHLYFHPSDFMMIHNGNLDSPHKITLKGMPSNWKVAVSLEKCEKTKNIKNKIDDEESYCAKDAHRLYDSPFEISDYQELTYESHGATFHIIFSGEGGPYDLSVFDFAKDFKKFTDAQCEIFGGTPGDLKDYWFLLFPGGGGGLEHRYSTTTYFSTSVFDGDIPSYWWLISVSSHELFHAWNVKRIRPSEMVPYSYSEAKPTTLLWVSEGFTSYFGTLTMARGGNISIEDYLSHMEGKVKSISNSRGYPNTSAALSSYDSWIGSGTAREQRNVSYYTSGEMLGFFMDSKLRHDSKNKVSVDQMMKWLYEEKWDNDRGPGFTEENLVEWLENSTEEDNGWEEFFDKWIRGSDPLPLEDWDWSLVNLEANSNENAELGMETSGSWPLKVTHVYPDSPAAKSGLAINDEIIYLNTGKITKKDLKDLELKTPITYIRNNNIFKTSFLPTTRKTWDISIKLPEENTEERKWANDWLRIDGEKEISLNEDNYEDLVHSNIGIEFTKNGNWDWPLRVKTLSGEAKNWDLKQNDEIITINGRKAIRKEFEKIIKKTNQITITIIRDKKVLEKTIDLTKVKTDSEQ